MVTIKRGNFMKNIAIIAIMLAVIFLTMGCSIPSQKTNYDNPVVGNDSNAGIRPYNFPMTKWISDHPKMWFEIRQSDDSQGMVKECGYVEEINLEIAVYFDCFDGIYIYDKMLLIRKFLRKIINPIPFRILNRL